MADAIRKSVGGALRAIRRTSLPEFLAHSLSGALVILGGTLIGAPGAYERALSFNPAFTFASPAAWAVAMMGTGLLCSAMVVAQRAWAFVPFMAQTGVWSLWAVFTIGALPGGGIPSASVIYTLAAWVAFMVTAVYWGELDEQVRADRRQAGK